MDTSTLVSATLRIHSIPRRALQSALALLGELETVLTRPRFAQYATTEAFHAFIDSLREETLMISVPDVEMQNVDPPCRDSTDHHVLSLARTASAKLIIASDRDLLVLHPWQGIPI